MNMRASVVVLSLLLTLATGAAAQESAPYTYLTIAGDDTLAS